MFWLTKPSIKRRQGKRIREGGCVGSCPAPKAAQLSTEADEDFGQVPLE